MSEDRKSNDFDASSAEPHDVIAAAVEEHAREMQKWEAAAGTPDTPPAAAPAPAEPSRELTQYAPAYYSVMKGEHGEVEVVHDDPVATERRALTPLEELQRQNDERCFPNAARRREQEARIHGRSAPNVPTTIYTPHLSRAGYFGPVR
jgi:hypothetical protein